MDSVCVGDAGNPAFDCHILLESYIAAVILIVGALWMWERGYETIEIRYRELINENYWSVLDSGHELVDMVNYQ